MKELMENTGIYLTYPKDKAKQSIYKAKNYKTEVNNQCTKIGIVETSFASREKAYKKNFGDIEFMSLAIVNKADLKTIEKTILIEIKKEFKKVGRSREWFHTTNRNRIIDIVRDVLCQSNISCEIIF
jgi:hypothetical protein